MMVAGITIFWGCCDHYICNTCEYSINSNIVLKLITKPFCAATVIVQLSNLMSARMY